MTDKMHLLIALVDEGDRPRRLSHLRLDTIGRSLCNNEVRTSK